MFELEDSILILMFFKTHMEMTTNHRTLMVRRLLHTPQQCGRSTREEFPDTGQILTCTLCYLVLVVLTLLNFIDNRGWEPSIKLSRDGSICI